jgi:uncharacterized protein YecE (DUF72 family)
MAKSAPATKTPKKSVKKAAKPAKEAAPKAKTAKPKAVRPAAKVNADVAMPQAAPKPQTVNGGGNVYIGIGGWTFEPWRGVFYPDGLSHAKELAYAAHCLSSIEINGTFYRTQTPATFHKWASEVPNGFKFSVKGVRYVTNRGVLAEAGDSIKWFMDSGVLELGDRLGPLLWQMNPFKKFDEVDFGKFLELLPHKVGDQRVRHVVEVRNDSFKTPAFIALLRQFNVGIVYSEHETYTEIADVTSDFVYARLQKGDDNLATGYPPKALDAWAERLKIWAKGGHPDDLPRIDKTEAPKQSRDVFAYVIHEGKVRAPAAAMELIKRLG